MTWPRRAPTFARWLVRWIIPTGRGAMSVERRDWLLLLVAGEAIGAAGPEELDPVRIQKGMFLLAMRGPARDVYTFRPYNWGPFSPQIYSDLDALVTDGLLEARTVPGQTWVRYRPTSAGVELARSIADQLDNSSRSWLRSAREFLTTRSFTKLLADLYDAYPQYATRSMLRR